MLYVKSRLVWKNPPQPAFISIHRLKKSGGINAAGLR
jgi:hypothetical protein